MTFIPLPAVSRVAHHLASHRHRLPALVAVIGLGAVLALGGCTKSMHLHSGAGFHGHHRPCPTTYSTRSTTITHYATPGVSRHHFSSRHGHGFRSTKRSYGPTFHRSHRSFRGPAFGGASFKRSSFKHGSRSGGVRIRAGSGRFCW